VEAERHPCRQVDRGHRLAREVLRVEHDHVTAVLALSYT
jgi:hypothetical protein